MESGGGRAGLQQQAAGGGGGGGGWVLVEALLQGGAPWGFTLQGGLEHGEPLIISKVEEGGKADVLEQPLLVGDEIVVINEVELTGYRQEAIALVKGSFKTLQLTVRREFDPGYIEEFDTPCSSPPALPPPSPPPLSSLLRPSTPQQQQTPSPSHHSRPCSAGGVQLRIKKRRSEPVSRPHSWHSTKLGDGQQELDQGGMDTMSSAWHHSYHASASTTDLSGGFDSSGSYLRKSPDQYSSRGSMESLDPPQSSHLRSGAQHHHHHTHSGPHPAYSSCHQLSSARSSNSIDHLHNKRDSAYSSFSTSSSIPDYLASNPSFSQERSYSLETVPQRGGGSGELQQADMRYVRTVYDAQQGLSQEQEVGSTSAAFLPSNDSRGSAGTRTGPSRDMQGSVSGVCYRGSSSGSSSSGSSCGSVPASNRHSVGPIWGPAASHSSYESLKGAPAPPRRSDSYAAIRNHERPNSWSSLDHARSLRSLQKGSWHHSSGPVASGTAKSLYSAEGQLHTVIEKSPESSPTTKPRQGGGLPQCPSPTGPAAQSGRFILPTGMYPVPQPEPHFAQIPSTNPGPGSSGVYPALAKESVRQQHQGLDSVGRMTEGQNERRMSTTENGYQNSASSSPYFFSSSSTSSSNQFRAQTHENDRPHREESYLKSAGGGSKGQAGSKRPLNHQGPHNQSFQEPFIYTSQAANSQVFQEPSQDFYVPKLQSTSEVPRPSSSQEWRDPSTCVQTWGDRSRSMDQTSVHSEPLASPKLAQGQVPPAHFPVYPHPQPQAPSIPASQLSPRHLSDSAALQYQHWEQDKDKDHPLTRLEIALAEVQQPTGPDSVFSPSSYGNSNFGEDSQGPVRSLSVLEKVSRFERRERAGKQRSQSTASPHRASQVRLNEKSRSTACGAEDLRNMLERSTSISKAHRTMSYRGGSNEQTKHRTPADPNSALQRSRSSFHINDSREGGSSSKDFPWRQEVQQLLGSVQDTSTNRSYRDSLKDAQSKVLRSTSFKRRDLDTSISPPPPSASPPPSSSSSHQPSPVPAKFHSPEKKGPKTMPKPQGVVIPSQSPPPITSPHAPKERHVVCPEVRGPSPPALPSVPPVGPPAVMRICGRKRLAADQKKRSYSEPENLHELGVSDPETMALFRRGGETSVADRRRMFEQNTSSRTDLRQQQQDALAEYVKRKRSVKKEEGGQRNGQRPHSAFLQPENSNHAASSGHSDTLSLSSASSLLSLQESSVSSEGRSLCSSLPPGADIRSFQSNFFYPGRVTSPRPPAQPTPGAPSPAQLHAQSLQDLSCESGNIRQRQTSFRDPGMIQQQQMTESKLHRRLSKQLNGALQRAGSARGSEKSASADDLLERTEERQVSPHHSRSRSSPIVEMMNQNLPPSEVRVYGVFISEPRRCSLAADRPEDIQASRGPVSPQHSHNNQSAVQPAGPGVDPSSIHTPVTRRERQRNNERQRSNSTTTLAASVGLPCPFSPSGADDSTDWRANDRLSQANLNDITFPGIPQTSKGEGGNTPSYNETPVMDRRTRRSLGDAVMLEDTAKDVYRDRAFSLETRGGNKTENAGRVSLTDFQLPDPLNMKDIRDNAPSPPSPLYPSYQQRLSSLRISESSLLSPTDQHPPLKTSFSQEDSDEVFLKNPAHPSTHSQVTDTNMEEDFPPPPPPVELEQEVVLQTLERTPKPQSPPASPSSTVFPSPMPSHPPLQSQQSTTINSITTSTTAEDSFGLEYQPLPKREKTSEELRVEMLARQLVQQDHSLSPVLDTWDGKSTVELMEDIFPNSKAGGRPLWQRRGSRPVDDRIQAGVLELAETTVTDGGNEFNLDEECLNTKKVELCEALRSSVAALRQEKEALSEEQRRHQALGLSIETLVQEQLKPNEREKYSMFIGDLERIVNLLLSLCSRLSRIDRSLLALEREEGTREGAAEERDSLHHKRSLLLCQTEDARELKENLDRRQRVVHAILTGYLTNQQLQDYRHFVSTKPSLLIRQRQLDDLIRQEEEQLTRLAESLPQEVAEAHGWSRGFPFLSSSPSHCSSPVPTILPPAVTHGPANSVRSTTVTSL